MRISDWSSDVCSSDLVGDGLDLLLAVARAARDDGAAEATRGTVQHPAAGRQVVGKAVVHDVAGAKAGGEQRPLQAPETGPGGLELVDRPDRKSTRLNSSH